MRPCRGRVEAWQTTESACAVPSKDTTMKTDPGRVFRTAGKLRVIDLPAWDVAVRTRRERVGSRAIAIPAAMAHPGTMRRSLDVGAVTTSTSASFAGQTATHSRHPMHSAERTCTSLSTGRTAGHAFAHFAQSMQGFSLRAMRTGLKSAASPIRAPYGHK